MKSIPLALYFALLSSFLLFSSCGENDDEEIGGSSDLAVQTATDIPADASAVSGPPGQGPLPNYTFYSLANGKVLIRPIPIPPSGIWRWQARLSSERRHLRTRSGPGPGSDRCL